MFNYFDNEFWFKCVQESYTDILQTCVHLHHRVNTKITLLHKNLEIVKLLMLSIHP